jgi:hypothetical protein
MFWVSALSTVLRNKKSVNYYWALIFEFSHLLKGLSFDILCWQQCCVIQHSDNLYGIIKCPTFSIEKLQNKNSRRFFSFHFSCSLMFNLVTRPIYKQICEQTSWSPVIERWWFNSIEQVSELNQITLLSDHHYFIYVTFLHVHSTLAPVIMSVCFT